MFCEDLILRIWPKLTKFSKTNPLKVGTKTWRQNTIHEKMDFRILKQPFGIRERFIELKHRELNDREQKIKREIEELFFEPIIVSIDDMDNFEQKEMKKKDLLKISGTAG